MKQGLQRHCLAQWLCLVAIHAKVTYSQTVNRLQAIRNH